MKQLSQPPEERLIEQLQQVERDLLTLQLKKSTLEQLLLDLHEGRLIPQNRRRKRRPETAALEERILLVLRRENRPMKSSWIQSRIGGSAIKPSTFRTVIRRMGLKQLIKAGRVYGYWEIADPQE